MAENEIPNRVEGWWQKWSRAYPVPPFESEAYNLRKLEFIERMKREFEKLPRKTREEEATMRKLDRETQQLRKWKHPGLMERIFSEQRNPVARFIAQLLKKFREMGNDRREKAGASVDKYIPRGAKVERFPPFPAQKKEKEVKRVPGNPRLLRETFHPGKERSNGLRVSDNGAPKRNIHETINKALENLRQLHKRGR